MSFGEESAGNMCMLQRIRETSCLLPQYGSVKTKLTIICIILLTFCVQHAVLDCSIKFEEYRSRRVLALQFQILTKLGFSQAPDDTGPDELPDDLIKYYNQTVELMEEKYASSKKHCTSSSSIDEPQESDDEEDINNYFAQVPMIFDAEENWEGWNDFYFLSRGRYARFYWFNISRLEGRAPSDVTDANFRLYQINNTRMTMEQVISVYKLVKMKNDIIPKHVFTKSFDPQHEGPIAIDVTKVVQDWLEDPDSNYGFEVSVECGEFMSAQPWNSLEIEFGDPRGSYTESANRGDIMRRNYQTPDKHPKLIVMTSGNYSKLLSPEGHSRRKRSYNNNRRCDDTVTTCCKRSLYVNFQRDLDWKWIRQPKGFFPNLCAGNCLYIRADNSMYHQLIRYHRDTNPNASPSPCCSPLSFKPLTVLFYEKSIPKIMTLQNLVVDACGCR